MIENDPTSRGARKGVALKAPAEATSIHDLVEAGGFGGTQIRVCLLATMVIVLDGLSMQMLGFAGPLIIREWNIDKLDFGAAVAAALVGMAFGTFFGGPTGDRLGRRPALIWSVGLFGVASIGCGFAQGLGQLSVLRFASGLGFGACFPAATSLISEWTPLKHRSLAIAIMTIGVPLGGMLGAGVALAVLPTWGWRGCFIASGLLALAHCALLFAFLPESAAWLASRHDRRRQLETLLRKFWPSVSYAYATTTFEPGSSQEARERVLTRANLRSNVGLWLAFMANMLTGFALVSWSTVILTALGIPLNVAVGAALPYSVASIVMALGASFLIARFGTLRSVLVLAGAGVAAGVAAGWFIALDPHSPLLGVVTVAAFAGMGGCISGIQSLLFVLAANAFPTSCRATGVGFSVAAGRAGAVAGAFGGGYVLTAASPPLFFVLAAAGLVIVAVGGLTVDCHIRPRGGGA